MRGRFKEFESITGYRGLYRRSNGIYYFRGKVRGKSILRSLDTKDKAGAVKRLEDYQSLAASLRVAKHEELTGETAVKILLGRYIEGHADHQIDPLRRNIKRITRTWPDFLDSRLAEITRHDLETWKKRLMNASKVAPPGARRLPGRYSPSAINKSIVVLRKLFDLAVEDGQISRNPAREYLKQVVERPVERPLPSREQVDEAVQLLRTIRTARYTFGRDAADEVELMSRTGMRPAEAQRSTLSDYRGTHFIIHGTKTKAAPRKIPVFPRLREFLERVERRPEEPILRRKSCIKTINRALSDAGAPSVTRDTWRHWFITEQVSKTNIPFSVLAEWVGHSDGGVLLARNYTHLRDSTSSRWGREAV